MKKCILSILIVMLLFPLYADDPSAEANVKLDLNADGFIIGFAKDKFYFKKYDVVYNLIVLLIFNNLNLFFFIINWNRNDVIIPIC